MKQESKLSASPANSRNILLCDVLREELSGQIFLLCKHFIEKNNIDAVSINCQFIDKESTEMIPVRPPMPSVVFAFDSNKRQDIFQPKQE